jgi:uncharacterized membrane protein
MSNLIVVSFPDEQLAFYMRAALAKLQIEAHPEVTPDANPPA